MKITVGMGSCGIAAGALEVWNRLTAEVEERQLDVSIGKNGCIGMCYIEPLIDVTDDSGNVYIYGNITPHKAVEVLDKHIAGSAPVEKYLVSSDTDENDFLKKQTRIALRNCGRIDPETIRDYIAKDGYKALKRVVTEMTPQEVIAEIKLAGLRGRGGAGFPTWFKWDSTLKEKATEKYLICNADEGDPGAFMDRSILEGDPHSVLEGMLIAGYATGAQKGIIYCRAEYPLAIKRLQKAIEMAYKSGFLGEKIFDRDFFFDIFIKAGAGAFVCGEETALIASLEGERGMPRLKPPFPSQKGYWEKPSTINNVETLANIPWIINNGASSFGGLGTAESKGTKVFALAGKIKNGGLVEVPMGMSLRDIIFTIGGGIKADRQFKAVQMGGPSGGCIPAELLNTPVDYQSITDTGAIMGSGGMVVVDEDTCMVEMARFFLDFTQKESCGKCVQCRIGTKRMLEILERICKGKGKDGDIELLEELAVQIKDVSLCGLGQSAPNPVLTTIRYFRDEYEQHIYEKRCPAKKCKELITFSIDPEKCVGCGICKRKCPVNCISGDKKGVHIIDQNKCTKCGTCLEVCPARFSAVKVE